MNEQVKDRTEKVLNHILRQVKSDGAELSKLQSSIGWEKRAAETAEKFVPILIEKAKALKEEVEDTLNSPQITRAVWKNLKDQLKEPKLKIALKEMDEALALEKELLSVITGETVSKLIANFLCRNIENLKENNRSTYPDLYFTDVDYGTLPVRTKENAAGPARRKSGEPTSIPDGIEIKSNKGSNIRVDSHHDHQGLHLALTFGCVKERWHVYDIYLAYLTKADYTRAARNTTATTDKFSFKHKPFISVTTGEVKQGALADEESSDGEFRLT